MSGQNLSSAVMAQRVEPQDSLDYFPTPPWATRALCEWLAPRWRLQALTAWEPACGGGAMARPLAEYFRRVHASDVHDYGIGVPVFDFLADLSPAPDFLDLRQVDFVVTNPPFRCAATFIQRAMAVARCGVAMLVRTQFLEGQDRYDSLFRLSPPQAVLQFCERVPMVKGRLDRSASTATSYCWLIWVPTPAHLPPTTEFHWLPPCRSRLDRAEDWPVPVSDTSNMEVLL